MNHLFTPVHVGRYSVQNRLAMAPMTRSRANPDGTPTPLMAQHYAQRASLGLIVSEATQPSAIGQGNIATPGIYSDAHVQGWKRVTSAIHENGGDVFIQIMHAGRMSHPENVQGKVKGTRP